MARSVVSRPGFWQIVLLDLAALLLLIGMATDESALDAFHLVFLVLVAEAFLQKGWSFWLRLGAALGATELLIIRVGGAAWQDVAEPVVLATIATLVFLMHSSRERDRQLLRAQATHDVLTGLLNRRALQTHLDVAVSRLHRDHTPFAVIYLDLDGFKMVNDRYGHDIGDMILVEAGNRIERVTRGIDVVGRIGGDEFALLLGTATTPEDAEQAAQRLVTELAAPFHIDEHAINLSASMGIAMATAASRPTAQELLSSADRAMYDVKNVKRGSYGFAKS